MKKLKNFLLAIAILTITGSSVNCAFQRKVDGRSINGPQEDTDQLRSNVSIQLHSSGRNTRSHREFLETEPLDQHPAEEAITVEPIVKKPAIEESNELTEAIQLNFEHFMPTPTDDLRYDIWKIRSFYPNQFKELIVRTFLIMNKKYKWSAKTFITKENMITIVSFYIEHYNTTNQEINNLRNKIKTFNQNMLYGLRKKYLNSYIGQNFLEKLENILHPTNEEKPALNEVNIELIEIVQPINEVSIELIETIQPLNEASIELIEVIQPLNEVSIELIEAIQPEVNIELIEAIQLNFEHFMPTPTDDLISEIWIYRGRYIPQFKELLIRIFLILSNKYSWYESKFISEQNIITLVKFYIQHYNITNQEINNLCNEIKAINLKSFYYWEKKYANSNIGIKFIKKLESLNSPDNEKISNELIEIIKLNSELFTQTPTNDLISEIWKRRRTKIFSHQFKEFFVRTFLILEKKDNSLVDTFFVKQNIITLIIFYTQHYDIDNQKIDDLYIHLGNFWRFRLNIIDEYSFLSWKEQYLNSNIGQNFLEKLENINLDVPNSELSDPESEENILIPAQFDIDRYRDNQL